MMKSRVVNESQLFAESRDMRTMEEQIDNVLSSINLPKTEATRTILQACRYRRMVAMAEYGTRALEQSRVQLDQQIIEEVLDLINWVSFRMVKTNLKSETREFEGWIHNMVGWLNYIDEVHEE